MRRKKRRRLRPSASAPEPWSVVLQAAVVCRVRRCCCQQQLINFCASVLAYASLSRARGQVRGGHHVPGPGAHRPHSTPGRHHPFLHFSFLPTHHHIFPPPLRKVAEGHWGEGFHRGCCLGGFPMVGAVSRTLSAGVLGARQPSRGCWKHDSQ